MAVFNKKSLLPSKKVIIEDRMKVEDCFDLPAKIAEPQVSK